MASGDANRSLSLVLIDGPGVMGLCAHFYALIPPDNTTGSIPAVGKKPISDGAPVNFPRTAPGTAGVLIRRKVDLLANPTASTNTFILGPIGVYQVDCHVPVSVNGQLMKIKVIVM